MPEQAAPGVFFAVVGPSGAGKDSLIGYARQRLGDDPHILFVRRVVTRPATAALEDHDTMTAAGFAEAAAAGRFAATWEAHGLSYGIPATALAHVLEGGAAVANCSRAALPSICSAFPKVTIISVTAPPEVLAQRLSGRGRETADDIARRLARKVETFPREARLAEIDNGGALETAGERFLAVLQGLR